MGREEDLVPPHIEVRRDNPAHPDLLPEGVLDGVGERSPRARKRAKRAGENPVELQHAALVENDRIEIGGGGGGTIEAPLKCRGGERRGVLPPRQPPFLPRAAPPAPDHAGGGGGGGGGGGAR